VRIPGSVSGRTNGNLIHTQTLRSILQGWRSSAIHTARERTERRNDCWSQGIEIKNQVRPVATWIYNHSTHLSPNVEYRISILTKTEEPMKKKDRKPRHVPKKLPEEAPQTVKFFRRFLITSSRDGVTYRKENGKLRWIPGPKTTRATADFIRKHLDSLSPLM